MRFCRNCGRDVRFGNDKVNIQPTVQLVMKLQGYLKELEYRKRVLVKEKDHFDDAVAALMDIDDALNDMILLAKKAQNEIRKEL